MMKKSLTLLIATGVLAGVGYAQGRLPMVDDPLLKQVFEAQKSIKFAGIRIVYFRDKDGKMMKIEERVLRSGRDSRTEFPENSPYHGQIIVENKYGRQQYDPRTKEIRVGSIRLPDFGGMRGGRGGGGQKEGGGGPGGPGSPGGPPQGGQRGGMMQKPTIRVVEGGKVAGIPTKLLEMSGEDHKPFLKIWIDTKMKVALKMERLNREGQSSGGYEFTAIRYNPELKPGVFELKIPGAKVVTATDDLRRAAKSVAMKAYKLPTSTGFELTDARKFDSERGKGLIQMYSSSQARITLFQLTTKVDPDKLTRGGRSRVNAHVWQKGGVNFVMLSSLDKAKLQKLAGQLTPID